MPELNISQETLDTLIMCVKEARGQYQNLAKRGSTTDIRLQYEHNTKMAENALAVLKDFDKAQMKAGGVCCPACEAGEHDTPFSRLNHMTMKCDCPCNMEKRIALPTCIADCGCGGAQLAHECGFLPGCSLCDPGHKRVPTNGKSTHPGYYMEKDGRPHPIE